MIITIHTEDDGKHTYFGIKEFTVVGAMNITGTDEVEFGKRGFRFEDNRSRGTKNEKEQSTDSN